MVSDSTKLQALIFFFSIFAVIVTYYLWYIVLKHIHATDFIWFVWVFSATFGIIIACVKVASDNYNGRIKNLEDRVSRLERK